MILKFDAKGVRRLVEHAEKAKEHRNTYGQEGDPQPGLILVGDHGVYLMSNGLPKLPANKSNPDQSLVVYAEGINPYVDDFEDWWFRKGASFGGDDGAEGLSLDRIEPYIGKKYLHLDVTEKHIISLDESEVQ